MGLMCWGMHTHKNSLLLVPPVLADVAGRSKSLLDRNSCTQVQLHQPSRALPSRQMTACSASAATVLPWQRVCAATLDGPSSGPATLGADPLLSFLLVLAGFLWLGMLVSIYFQITLGGPGDNERGDVSF